MKNDEARKELDKIKEVEKNADREKLIYKTNDYTYSFKNFQTIKTFDRDIYEGKITLKKAIKYRTNLLAQIMDFRANTKPKSQEKKQEKEIFLKTCIFVLRVKLRLKKLLNTEPIYWLKLWILGQIQNQRVKKKNKKKKFS